MIFGNIKRGNESPMHVYRKFDLGKLALRAGADAVRYEVSGCDFMVLKWINHEERGAGFEIEMSSRNVIRNISRDLDELGCVFVVVVAASERLSRSIVALIGRRLDPGLAQHVLVISADELSEEWLRKVFRTRLGGDRSPDESPERGSNESNGGGRREEVWKNTQKGEVQ